MASDPTYLLLDGRELAREAPYTFFLPRPEDLDGLRPGDHAKLIFEWIPPGEEYSAERMWVEVSAVEGEFLVGVLDNQPCEDRMQLGDEVRFCRSNVIAILRDGRELPLFAPQGDYWSRCLVDACVLSREEPVEYLYREEPDPELQGADKDPDSGWRIRGRQGDASDQEMEDRKAAYVALGAVLNADDSWLHLIGEPVGSAFMRNFATGVYEWGPDS